MTAFPLRYVCAFCGETVAEFPDQAASEPAVMSVCDAPECRAKASAKYKGTAVDVPEDDFAGMDVDA